MRILLIEDHVPLAQSIVRGLKAEGMVVDHVENGIEGSWLARNNPYDVIICDIMLPGKNGYQIVRELRQAQVWTPVLMLTAKDGEYDQADAFDLGADDYLIKPFHFVVLVARLRALARRGAPARPAVFTCGPITIDPAAHLASAGGAPLELSATEFALLSFLVRRAGEVLSKPEILDNVWGADFSGSENIVEVYVRKIRTHLARAGVGDMIHTVRGAGYRLEVAGVIG